MSADYQPEQLRQFERELQHNQALIEGILSRPDVFPPLPEEPERVIRCSPENVERAICRAFARCRERGEFWLIEVMTDEQADHH